MNIVELLKAIVFGIVEGITEWSAHQQYRSHDPSGGFAALKGQRGVHGDVPCGDSAWCDPGGMHFIFP